ncbi:MAG: PepSY-associated TM helix domain-containing protein, partial [Gammaproteobacteria bacterium]
RALRQPKKLLIRKIAFQIHLWIGIAIGLYIVVLSVTGSALVFRREMDRAFAPDRPVRDPARQTMSVEALTAAAQRAYPDHTILRVGDIQRRTPVIQVDFTSPSGETVEREFSAYTGEDIGDPFPASAEWLLWVVSLHDDLLIVRDQRGRFWNGVGSILATLLCITGAIVWWPGISSWRRGISIKRKSSWKRFNFDTHSALGFWFFSIIAIWAVSGIYLAMPTPFKDVANWFFGPQPDNIENVRVIDRVMEWMVRLHFGRWRSHTLKVVWVIMGLIPAIMFVTGSIMWWNRVVRKPRTARVRESKPVLAFQQEPQRAE